jgi:transposase-like protein
VFGDIGGAFREHGGLGKEALMPWQECSSMSQRQELVALAKAGQVGVTELAKRFGVSRKTAYT